MALVGIMKMLVDAHQNCCTQVLQNNTSFDWTTMMTAFVIDFRIVNTLVLSFMMANINEFIDRLNTYDKESIDSAMLSEIKPFKDQAQPERVRQILPACHQLALWVKCTYNHKGKKPS